MAKEEKVEEGAEEEEKPKKKLPKLPIKLLAIIAGSVAGLVLVVIVASVVARSVKHPVVEFGPEAPEGKREVSAALVTWLAGTPEGFLARLADKEETHLVKTGEFRLAYDPKYKQLPAELFERQFQISDLINTVLITKTSEDLSSEEGKNELKREIINRINKLLIKGQIEDIYVQIMVQ